MSPQSKSDRRFAQEGTPPKNSPILLLVESLLRLLRGLWKYAEDILALILLAFALVALLGFAGLSSGAIVKALVAAFRVWFGWGALLVPLTAAGAGAALLA
ncbi:MAG: hypothetical protein HY023_10100, partial [Chloroflexi bacterium]|nr:hypothetical protein [Chloroflexota bacterium]